jgi:hypothetical protein
MAEELVDEIDQWDSRVKLKVTDRAMEAPSESEPCRSDSMIRSNVNSASSSGRLWISFSGIILVCVGAIDVDETSSNRISSFEQQG